MRDKSSVFSLGGSDVLRKTMEKAMIKIKTTNHKKIRRPTAGVSERSGLLILY